MKKKIAVCFLLLANIVLLAHAVLPHHHHHDGSVCFFFHSCDKDKDHHNGYETCSLEVFIKQLTGQDQIKHEQPALLLSVFIIPNNNLDLRQITSYSFEHIAFLNSGYSFIVLPPGGLRAPPVTLS